MRLRACTAALIGTILTLAISSPLAAGEAELHCYSKFGTTLPATGWAHESLTNRHGGSSVDTVDQTNVGTGTETVTRGFTFENEADAEIHCSLILPLDYNSSAAFESQVVIFGWATQTVACN